MIVGLAALMLVMPAPVDPVGARLAASSKAAQALQGPLDGSWVLIDAEGGKRLRLQIVDPAVGGHLSAAWREPGLSEAAGYVDEIERGPFSLVLRLGGHDHRAATVIWLHGSGSRYRGKMDVDGKVRTITLTKDH